MTYVFMEGWDMYNGVTASDGKGIQAKWKDSFTKTNVGTSGFSLVAGRSSGQALSYNSAPNFGQAQEFDFPGSATLTIGFAIRIDTLGTVSSTFPLMFTTAGNFQWAFAFDTAGTVTIQRTANNNTGTIVGTSAVGILAPIGFWHSVIIQVTMGTATTGQVKVFIDDFVTPQINVTNVNILNFVTSNLIDAIHVGAGRGDNRLGKFSIDDMYINNTILSTIGDRKIETLRPNGDDTKVFVPNTGTNNFDRVNETLVDGDTTYVQGTNVGDRDIYTLGDLAGSPTIVDAINVVSFAEKTDIGLRSIANSIKSNTTDSDGGNFALNTTYQRFDRIVETDPATSAAWTATGVNALKLGPKVTV